MASAEEIAKSLTGLIGKNDEAATVSQFLDTGFPPLNYALSGQWDGGFPVGRVVEVSGPPSAGKTAISTKVMSAAQKLGGIAAFADHERSFALKLAKNIGLEDKAGKFIYKKPETLEESFGLCTVAASHIRQNKLIAPSAPIVWVFDSLAAMVPYNVLYDSKGNLRDPKDRNMKDNLGLAAAASAHLPALAQKAEDLGVLVIILNQLRTKPGVVYGDPIYTPGGNAKEFYFSQRVRLSAQKIQQGKGADAQVLGMEVTAKVIKNKVSRPFLTASWRFMFQPDGSGRFDVERSLVEFLASEGLLKPAKPGYVEWGGKTVHKETLARDIEKRGAFKELTALLPAAYEPPVVAEVDLEVEAAAA
jgi:recombination protein RecA